jgi:hypothetical protein
MPQVAAGIPDIECCYKHSDHPAVLAVKTTARSLDEQQAALAWLARHHGSEPSH